MNKVEMNKVMRCADARTYPTTPEFAREAQIALAGFGIKAEGKKYATIQQAALVLNYQTLLFNGTRDAEAVQETLEAYKENVIIIG